MSRLGLALLAAVAATAFALPAAAQQPQPAAPSPPAAQPQRPTFATTKVEGTEGVYIFRNQNHQAMFIVTKEGVIATDPIGYGRPQAADTYVDEIKKVTTSPIKYLIYSHHHFDHTAGGKPFKDAGARIVAHKRATERLKILKDAATPVPDESINDKKVIKLGGTTLELHYLGRNHSNSSLVMFLPKEKIIFAVDWNSLGAVPSRLAVERLLSDRVGSLAQEDARPEMGAPDPRPPRSERPARHARRHGAAACLHERPFNGGEEGFRRGQVLRSGNQGSARSESTARSRAMSRTSSG